MFESISIWEWVRATGFTSLLLLFFANVAGVVYSLTKNGKTKGLFMMIHQLAGWIGFLIAIFHGFILYYDSYLSYSLVEIFIPFTSDHERFLSGIGSLSLIIFLIVLATSDLLKKIGKKVWKVVHLFSVPAFLLAFVHGLMMGTDTSKIWAICFYAITFAVLFSVLFVRKLSKS